MELNIEDIKQLPYPCDAEVCLDPMSELPMYSSKIHYIRTKWFHPKCCPQSQDNAFCGRIHNN